MRKSNKDIPFVTIICTKGSNMLKKIIGFIKDRISFTNYSKQDGKGKLPIEGKILVAISDKTSFRLSWNLWSDFHHFEPLKVDPADGQITTSIGFAPFAFWFSIENYDLVKAIAPHKPYHNGTMLQPREVRLAFHDKCVWWSFWMNPDEQKSDEPWYRRGSLDFADVFLGKERVTKEVVKGPERVAIPMYEGVYAARASVERFTYSRPLWPAKHKTMVCVTMDPREDKSFKPIPVPGKGENSYDCDEDAIYSTSIAVDDDATHEDAIAEVVRSVLKSRRRYGGKHWRPEAFRTADAAPN